MQSKRTGILERCRTALPQVRLSSLTVQLGKSSPTVMDRRRWPGFPAWAVRLESLTYT
jgi:hypothetical protein